MALIWHSPSESTSGELIIYGIIARYLTHQRWTFPCTHPPTSYTGYRSIIEPPSGRSARQLKDVVGHSKFAHRALRSSSLVLNQNIKICGVQIATPGSSTSQVLVGVGGRRILHQQRPRRYGRSTSKIGPSFHAIFAPGIEPADDFPVIRPPTVVRKKKNGFERRKNGYFFRTSSHNVSKTVQGRCEHEPSCVWDGGSISVE